MRNRVLALLVALLLISGVAVAQDLKPVRIDIDPLSFRFYASYAIPIGKTTIEPTVGFSLAGQDYAPMPLAGFQFYPLNALGTGLYIDNIYEYDINPLGSNTLNVNLGAGWRFVFLKHVTARVNLDAHYYTSAYKSGFGARLVACIGAAF